MAKATERVEDNTEAFTTWIQPQVSLVPETDPSSTPVSSISHSEVSSKTYKRLNDSASYWVNVATSDFTVP